MRCNDKGRIPCRTHTISCIVLVHEKERHKCTWASRAALALLIKIVVDQSHNQADGGVVQCGTRGISVGRSYFFGWGRGLRCCFCRFLCS